MLITKCDICKKEIKNRDQQITAGKFWHQFSFCSRCGKPITTFLRRRRLLTESKSDR